MTQETRTLLFDVWERHPNVKIVAGFMMMMEDLLITHEIQVLKTAKKEIEND